MNKKYNRLFLLDAVYGQEKWLNKMAQRGLRLVSVNYTAYEFETCDPGQYEYHIEVVKGKTKEEILDRQRYLARRGIKSIPKSISNNRTVGNAKAHSIGSGESQVVIVPDLKLPELLILERTKEMCIRDRYEAEKSAVLRPQQNGPDNHGDVDGSRFDGDEIDVPHIGHKRHDLSLIHI